MHLLKTLLASALVQQVISIPLNPEPSLLLRSLSLIERGDPPPQCADEAATEEQGCFTLQDASNKDVRFAFAPGQSFDQGIGKGYFARVARCVLKDGQDIAVKQFKIASEEREEMAERSFDFLKELEGNEHIVKAIARGKVQGKPAYAMELAQDGTIESRSDAEEYKGKEKEEAMKDVGNQVLDGLAWMYSKKIAHLDIQVGNFAFKGDTVKVIDFDFACKDRECLGSVPGGNGGRGAPGKSLSYFCSLNVLLIRF